MRLPELICCSIVTICVVHDVRAQEETHSVETHLARFESSILTDSGSIDINERTKMLAKLGEHLEHSRVHRELLTHRYFEVLNSESDNPRYRRVGMWLVVAFDSISDNEWAMVDGKLLELASPDATETLRRELLRVSPTAARDNGVGISYLPHLVKRLLFRDLDSFIQAIQDLQMHTEATDFAKEHGLGMLYFAWNRKGLNLPRDEKTAFRESYYKRISPAFEYSAKHGTDKLQRYALDYLIFGTSFGRLGHKNEPAPEDAVNYDAGIAILRALVESQTLPFKFDADGNWDEHYPGPGGQHVFELRDRLSAVDLEWRVRYIEELRARLDQPRPDHLAPSKLILDRLKFFGEITEAEYNEYTKPLRLRSRQTKTTYENGKMRSVTTESYDPPEPETNP